MIGYIIATKNGETYDLRYHSEIVGKELVLQNPPLSIVQKIKEINDILEANIMPEERVAILDKEIQAITEEKAQIVQEKQAVIVEKEQLAVAKAQVETEKAQVIEEKAQVIAEKEQIEQTAATYKTFLLQTELTIEQMLALIDIFPTWIENTYYEMGTKVKYNGKLYKVIQGHSSQADWTPETAASLFVEIVPPEVIPEWRQPMGAHDAYIIGDKVTFEGSIYTSLVDGNVWSPIANPAAWEMEVVEEPVEEPIEEPVEEPIEEPAAIPNWIQPTGGHDAYNIGDQVTFNGSVYESKIAANTYSPTDYPAGWQLI